MILVSHIGAISWLYFNKIQLLHGKNMKIRKNTDVMFARQTAVHFRLYGA